MRNRTGLTREVALWCLSVGTAIGCRRLLDGWSWLRPVVITITVAHVLGALSRRARVPLPLAALLALPAGAVTLALTFYASTTTVGLPTGRTVDAVRSDLDVAWSAFGSIRAPAEPLTGYALSIAATCWVVAFLADWAAFRLRSPFEAILPSGILFVFGALFARGPYRGVAALAWLVPALLFVLLAQIDRREATAAWVSGAARRGRATLTATGAGVAVIVGALAFAVSPVTPGDESEALIDIRHLGEGGDSTRYVDNPIVEVQSRLLDLPDVVVFTVETDRPDYWRLVSLEEFDGERWTLVGGRDDAEGELPSSIPDDLAVQTVDQEFDIEELEAAWAPAAYEPREVLDIAGGSLEYLASSSSLVVGDDGTTSDGMRYTIRSAVPDRDVAAIQAARPADPVAFAEYLDLPDDFSQRLIDEARVVTAGATTPYEQALALQNYFRTFTYDDQVERGHGIDRMEDFVLEVRRGYCEQFASTFAAFARVVGLPSRVAVGFTPGDFDPTTGTYQVRGVHAHAWPEVWLDGVGWLRFEPTPGRGAPGDDSYTGVVPQQAPGSALPSTTTTTTAAPSDGPAPTVPTAGDDEPVPSVTTPPSATDSGSSSPWPRRLAVIALLVVGPFVALAGAVRFRRWYRRSRAAEPADRIDVAWAEACEASARLDLGPELHETPTEYVDRVGHRLGTGGAALGRLAGRTVRARYSPHPPSPGDAEAAWSERDVVIDQVRQRATTAVKARAALDPRRPRHRI